MHASKGRKYYACTEKRSQKRREIMVTITRRDLCRLALLSLMVTFDSRSYTGTPVNRSQEAQDTAHTGNTPSGHFGEQEPSGPGHRTSKTTHRAGTPVNRSQVAQDTARAKQQAERAHP